MTGVVLVSGALLSSALPNSGLQTVASHAATLMDRGLISRCRRSLRPVKTGRSGGKPPVRHSEASNSLVMLRPLSGALHRRLPKEPAHCMA
jgi:hypothetical protein